MADPHVLTDLLPGNEALPRRSLRDVDTVVVHCTEEPTLADARRAARYSDDEEPALVAAHFYIDRDGSVVRYIEEDRVASHAAGHNAGTIGIELVNRGRWPHWFASTHQTPTEPYTPEQIEALKSLLVDLRRRVPSLTHLAAHSELDTRLVPASDDPTRQVRRRIDPGPLFPWQEIEVFWHDIAD